MPRKFTDTEQDSYFTQGLALGVLWHGTDWIPAGKLEFEFALSHAFASFPAATRFYRVMNDRRADPYYLLGRSERRRGPVMAAWRQQDRGWEPYVWQDGWSIEESGEMVSTWSETPWVQWQRLAREFLEYYRERGTGSPHA